MESLQLEDVAGRLTPILIIENFDIILILFLIDKIFHIFHHFSCAKYDYKQNISAVLISAQKVLLIAFFDCSGIEFVIISTVRLISTAIYAPFAWNNSGKLAW